MFSQILKTRSVKKSVVSFAHKWLEDLGTRPKMSIKVGCSSMQSTTYTNLDKGFNSYEL